ncbi:hypothetical protein EMIT040CA3_310056 [Bacillus pseudomycoides]
MKLVKTINLFERHLRARGCLFTLFPVYIIKIMGKENDHEKGTIAPSSLCVSGSLESVNSLIAYRSRDKETV